MALLTMAQVRLVHARSSTQFIGGGEAAADTSLQSLQRFGEVAVQWLQPYVLEPATLCARGCNHMC